MVDDAAGLAWIVNLGCIELHPHPVRTGDLDHPDELRIDLDPTPGVRLGRRPRGRAGGEGAARGDRPAAAGRRPAARAACTSTCASSRAGPSPRCGARRSRFSREIERRVPGCRDLEMVEGGAARRLPRLQPERQGPHDLLGLFGAPARPTRASRRRCTGTRCADCDPADFTVADVPARFAGDRRSARGDGRGRRFARARLLDARRAGRGRRSRRRAVAAALPQDGRRGAARCALPRKAGEDAAREDCRSSSSRTRRTRRPPLRASSAGRRSHAEAADAPRRRPTYSSTDARALLDMDAHSRQPRATSRRSCAPPQETPDPDDDPGNAASAPRTRRPRKTT